MLFFISVGILFSVLAAGIWYINRLKKENNQEKKELGQAASTKNRLFAVLEQEMRKPILVFRGISKKIDFLVEHKEYDTLKKLGDQLDKEAVSLNLLFENLLIWAKNQNDNFNYQPKPIPAKQVIDEINDIFLPLATEKGVYFSSNFSEAVHVNADLDSFMLLLKNILYQIIQESPRERKIQLLLTPKDSQVLLTISGLKNQSILQKTFSGNPISSSKSSSLDLSFTKELIHLNRGIFQFNPHKDFSSADFQLSFPRA